MAFLELKKNKQKKPTNQKPCVQMKDALISEKGMEKIWFPLLI